MDERRKAIRVPLVVKVSLMRTSESHYYFSKDISIGDLAKVILELCDSQASIVLDKRRVRPDNSEVQKLICDNSWAAENLGWQPQYSLRAGLVETIDWIRDNLEHYKATNYTV